MTEVTIHLDRDTHRRLRARARQAGTTVPLLVADLVTATAVVLSDPEWTTPPRSVLRNIAELVEHQASTEVIARQLGLQDDVVRDGMRELERRERLAQRYTR